MAGRKKQEPYVKPTLAEQYAEAHGQKERVDAASEAALEVVEVERQQEALVRTEQVDRERMIAQCHEVIGRVQANQLMAKFGNVASLVYLQQIKGSKIYRDLPSIGTWDKFCEYIGLSRRKVDEDLLNLSAFGEDFLETCCQLQVGYRDLKKLRQLTHEGAVCIEDDMVTIGGESIPLDAEHRDDLQAALERVIDAKDQLLQEKDATVRTKDKLLQAKEDLLRRQEKELSRYEKDAEKAGLTPAEDAFIKRMENLRVSFDGYMLKVDPERSELRFEEAERTPRMVAAYLTTLDYMRKQLLAAYDIAQDMYGSAVMTPEEAWKQPEE